MWKQKAEEDQEEGGEMRIFVVEIIEWFCFDFGHT